MRGVTTVAVARKHGVHHIVSFKRNRGLARAFCAGLDACLQLGADIVVNTDADNQYDARDIPKLIQPILEHEADIVVGSRPIEQIEHFSFLKKLLQRLGSWTVRKASKTDIEDAPSGFRAISREAAMQLNVFNDYTYTLETIIQAGQKSISVKSIPVRTNEYLRPSRLVKSILGYVRRSLSTIVRIFAVYKPFRFFMTIGVLLFVVGLIPAVRFIIKFVQGNGAGHIQSLILAAVLMMIGVQIGVLAFVGDLVAVNRKLLEDIQFRIKKLEYHKRIIFKKRTSSRNLGKKWGMSHSVLKMGNSHKSFYATSLPFSRFFLPSSS